MEDIRCSSTDCFGKYKQWSNLEKPSNGFEENRTEIHGRGRIFTKRLESVHVPIALRSSNHSAAVQNADFLVAIFACLLECSLANGTMILAAPKRAQNTYKVKSALLSRLLASAQASLHLDICNSWAPAASAPAASRVAGFVETVRVSEPQSSLLLAQDYYRRWVARYSARAPGRRKLPASLPPEKAPARAAGGPGPRAAAGHRKLTHSSSGRLHEGP